MFIEEYFDQVSSLSDVESGKVTYITNYGATKTIGKIFLRLLFSTSLNTCFHLKI